MLTGKSQTLKGTQNSLRQQNEQQADHDGDEQSAADHMVVTGVLAQEIAIRIHFPHDASPASRHFLCAVWRRSPWHMVRRSAKSTRDAAFRTGSSTWRAVSPSAA